MMIPSKPVRCKHSVYRRLRVERLESRQLMAIDLALIDDVSVRSCHCSDEFNSDRDLPLLTRAMQVGWSIGTEVAGPKTFDGKASSDVQFRPLGLLSAIQAVPTATFEDTSKPSFVNEPRHASALFDLSPASNARTSVLIVLSVTGFQDLRQTLLVIPRTEYNILSVLLSPTTFSQVSSTAASSKLRIAPQTETSEVTSAERLSQQALSSSNVANTAAKVVDFVLRESPTSIGSDSRSSTNIFSTSQIEFPQSHASLLKAPVRIDAISEWTEGTAPASVSIRPALELGADLQGMLQLSTVARETASPLTRNSSNTLAGEHRLLTTSPPQGEQLMRSSNRIFQTFDTDLPVPEGMIWLAFQETVQPNATESDIGEPLAASISPFAAFQIFLPGLAPQQFASTSPETGSISSDLAPADESAQSTSSPTLSSLFSTFVIAAWICVMNWPRQSAKLDNS